MIWFVLFRHRLYLINAALIFYFVVEAECIEDWSIIRNTGVYDTTLWDGKFSMEDCISKCYRDRACLGVNYFQYVLECYYIHNATLLLRRGRSEYLTLILRERRCPRPC